MRPCFFVGSFGSFIYKKSKRLERHQDSKIKKGLTLSKPKNPKAKNKRGFFAPLALKTQSFALGPSCQKRPPAPLEHQSAKALALSSRAIPLCAQLALSQAGLRQ
jgi:hypothetical protein